MQKASSSSRKLCNDDGNVHSNLKEVKDVIHNYFAQLFASLVDLTINKIIDYIKPKFINCMNDSLCLPYTKEEVDKALKQVMGCGWGGCIQCSPNHFSNIRSQHTLTTLMSHLFRRILCPIL